jgi:NhaP-type Na+/H+ or K+/H+ antiporter
MFFIGTVMGIGAELLDDSEDQLNESIRLWIPIDSEVLLLVFLPGLIFKDSLGQNVHLFQKSIVQLLIFAFPLVLAGTVLTALIAYYIFPYGWSFNLAMTFGSILSATDPVAVAALLEEVGAPPRLKVHIAGESLLNDGAAIVFFSIFVARYLFELGIEGVGEDVDWGRGVAMFCQKAIGGVCIGIFFGLGLLTILFLLKRRFNREENVVEVTATIAIAYIGYYVADAVWATSGVIATVTLGLMIKFLGRAMFNDAKLLEDFWTLVEHLLNTILFTLGGTVWGKLQCSLHLRMCVPDPLSHTISPYNASTRSCDCQWWKGEIVHRP